MALFAAAVVIVDFLVKRLVERTMQLHQTIPLIRGLFNLTYVRNPGAAFGMFAYHRWFFIVMAIIIVGVALFAHRHLTGGDRLLEAALGLIVGGAVGNLIDRLTTGLVVDFFELPHWPVFNVADMAIVFGVGLFLLGTLRTLRNEKGAAGR